MAKLHILSAAFLLILTTNGLSQEKPDYTSKVPQYEFPNTLEEQEKILEDHPMIVRFGK